MTNNINIININTCKVIMGAAEQLIKKEEEKQ